MPARLLLLRPLVAAALLLACALEGNAAARPGTAPPTPEVQRLEDLGRIWIYLDLFDPYLTASPSDWDQALIDAIPAVRGAHDDATYIAALNTMLRRSGDPAARVVETATPVPLPQPLRRERGTWVADCSAMAHAVATGAAPVQLAENVAANPTVVDCRNFTGNLPALHSVIAEIGRTRAPTILPAGSALVRSYNGFPSEDGAKSGGFAAGFGLTAKGSIAPTKKQPAKTPLVFMIDTGLGATALPAIAALQSAGLARVVANGPVGSGLATFKTARLTVQISEGLYTYPAGAVGFRPDATATPQNALTVAIAQLSARPSAVLREPSLPPLQRPPRRYNAAGLPPVEQRLLALYRFWGTIKYFQPYTKLMDRPWDTALAEYIPAMLTAVTRADYEAALLRLAARTQDTHTNIAGLAAPPYGFASGRPQIETRYIQGRLAVTEIVDKTLAPNISPGDIIVAIDGTPVAALEQRLSPFIAASTPQAYRAALAARLLNGQPGSVAVLQVRGPTGRQRTVRLPRTDAARPTTPDPAWRMLQGNVSYIDLARLARADADRALDELIEAKAIVFDLRGNPQGTAWVLGPRLALTNAPFPIAQFRRPSYQGPPKHDALEATWQAFADIERPSSAPARRYTGKIFALIDERTISQAEHTALFFKAAANVTLVGTPTRGTNGDVTALHLPGGLTLRFTGHDVRRADGTQLQRVGIKPDVWVAPTLKGLRLGRDEVLEKALDLARR